MTNYMVKFGFALQIRQNLAPAGFPKSKPVTALLNSTKQQDLLGVPVSYAVQRQDVTVCWFIPDIVHHGELPFHHFDSCRPPAVRLRVGSAGQNLDPTISFLNTSHSGISYMATSATYGHNVIHYNFVLFLLSFCLNSILPYSTITSISRARLCNSMCRMSVHLSVCDIQVLWSHRLEYFKNNFMAEY